MRLPINTTTVKFATGSGVKDSITIKVAEEVNGKAYCRDSVVVLGVALNLISNHLEVNLVVG